MNTLPKLDCEGYWDSESIKKYSVLDRVKKQLHRGNWSYLHRHPEIRAIIRVFIHELIDKQPDNVYEFSAAVFNCNNSPLLVTKINQQLKWVNRNLKQSRWSKYDGEMFFTNRPSTHSLLSKASVAEDKEQMLRYAMLLRSRK